MYEAKQLHRQIYVYGRVKTMNEKIYYNVDTIHQAIAEKKQILFKYFEYTVDKRKRYRHEGKNTAPRLTRFYGTTKIITSSRIMKDTESGPISGSIRWRT